MTNPFLGQINAVGFNFAPRGWAFCDGQLLPISQNTALFSLIGCTFGGDCRTSFALPDLRSRVAVHPGRGAGLSSYTWGERGGQETVTLTTNEIPVHNHGVHVKVADERGAISGAFKGVLGRNAYEDNTGNAVEVYVNESNASFTQGNTLGGIVENNVGSGLPVNNLQPFLGVYHCIALIGVFPSRS